jgi:DMSO/TMAO reductase YedYZ molybdopterin-dependent catalytic subunit
MILLALEPASSLLQSRVEAEGGALSSAALTWEVVIAVAVYAAIFAIVYALVTPLGRRRSAPAEMTPSKEQGMSRREILHRGLVLVVGSAGGFAVAQWLTVLGQAMAALAQTILDRVKGLPPEITPTESFYVVSKNPPGFDPVVNAQRWRLEVGGLVGKKLTMTYDQIKAMPSVSRPHTLECISNDVGGDLISNANWRGVPLKEVLDQAGGVGNATIQIAFGCADGYTESIPIAEALNPDTLLVYEIDGKPLPAKHGFPLRLLVPGHFGMKNPKWITKIDAVDHNVVGYWERSGWSQEAVVKTMSKFTVPGGHMTYKAGDDVGFGGIAYSGDRGIKTVEVSTDNGATWMPAQIKAPLGKYTWVLWAALWKPTAAGEYAVRVRATDGKGAVQVRQEVETLPDGASGYHLIRVRVAK